MLPAVGGYWLLTNWNYTRFQLVRDSGYHVLFRSAVTGFVLFSLARTITLFLEARWRDVSELWDLHYLAPFSLEVILSFLLAFLLPIVFNVFYSRQSGAEKAAQDSGDHTELLIAESIERQLPVEISLRNRKVYIGLAIESGIGSGSDSDIAIIPLYSGYRDEETLDLHIETDYLPIIWNYVNEDEEEDAQEEERGDEEEDGENWIPEEFRVVLPLSEIASGRLFDEEVYDKFLAHDLLNRDDDV